MGHWGANPGISFIYAHTNRVIKQWDFDCIFVVGSGHGAPGYIAPIYLLILFRKKESWVMCFLTLTVRL